MASVQCSRRPIVSRVAATRAAHELGIPASEARRQARSASAPGQQRRQAPRIRIVGRYSPENRAQEVKEESPQPQPQPQHEEAINYHLIIQTRPLEHPDKPQCEVIRRPAAAAPAPAVHVKLEEDEEEQEQRPQQQQQQRRRQLPPHQDQEQVQDIEQVVFRQARRQWDAYNIHSFAHQHLHSIHDRVQRKFVYHWRRDAGRNICSTWFGRWCVSLYDMDLKGYIWQSPGIFDFIRRLKDTTDIPLILSGRVDGRLVSTYDCRTRQRTWKAADFD